MLQVEHVTKRYGQTLANDDVSVHVQEGEVAVLLGPNGAGKSTLIKCVTGLLRFSGDIRLCGHGNKTREAKRLLGYIPEMPAVYDLLTVDEHLEFIRRAWKLDDGARAWGETLLERLQLADKRNKLGKELSKGMQQRVAVFDEPMVGLDPHAIKELKELFGEMRADGASVLISTHMLDSVEGIWDAAYIMMNGRIAARQRGGARDEQALETLFFQITEGRTDA